MNERCLLAERYLVLMPKCSEAMKCYVSNSMTVRDLCLILPDGELHVSQLYSRKRGYSIGGKMSTVARDNLLR